MSVETGWLLDDGHLCLGLERGGINLVCYTDENAIRFAREQDAVTMRRVLSGIGYKPFTDKLKPVEHSWG